MGLVTKNAILLVDYTKVLRRRGIDRRTALVTAGRTRLRPILMTTLAMIFGMLPLALAIGQGAEMRAPMARAVLGGLVTSTLLTLIVVPVVYSLLDDVSARVRSRWAKANSVAADEEARETGASPAARSALLVVLLVPCLSASAEVPPVPITLEEAVRIVQQKNLDIRKARSYQDWVRGKYVEERAGALPKLELLGGGVRSWDESYRVIFGDFYPPGQSVATTDVNVTQALFTWGQVGAAIRAAKAGMSSADDQLDSTRQAAVRDVTAAFYDVLLARRIEGIARENLAQRERHLDEARNRQRLGTATDYDVLAAEVAVENARPAVIRSVNLVLTARERLRFILADGRPGLDAAGTLETEVTDPPPFEEVLRAAIERRPDLRALRHRVDVYREFVRIQGAGDKPRLDLRAGAGWKWLEADGFNGNGKTWNAGLYLSFPFFDGLATKGKVIEARSDLATGRLDLEKAEDGVRLEVRNAVDAVRESALIVRALAGTVAQARRLLQMAEKGFEYGVKTRLEVDDAQLSVVQAEGNLATATRDHLVAWVTLRYVQGLL
jgi:outer membrane protein TolC